MYYWSHWSLHKLYSNWYNKPMYLVTIIASIVGNIAYNIEVLVKRSIINLRIFVRKMLNKPKSHKKCSPHEWTGGIIKLGGDSKGKFH